MSTPRRAFAARRKAMGYNQERFAVAVGIADFRTVGRWEQGENAPQPRHRARIATVLDATLDELDRLLWPEADDRPALGLPVVDVWSVLDADERAHVAAAIEEPYANFGPETLRCFERQVNAYMANDGVDGPTRVLPAIVELLAA